MRSASYGRGIERERERERERYVLGGERKSK